MIPGGIVSQKQGKGVSGLTPEKIRGMSEDDIVSLFKDGQPIILSGGQVTELNKRLEALSSEYRLRWLGSLTEEEIKELRFGQQ